MRLLALIVLAACSGPGDRPSDASVTTPDGQMQTETNVTCVDYTRTVTAASGSREVYVYKRAHVPDVGVSSNFIVVTCYPTSADPLSPGCPSGATCMGTSGPSGQRCFTNRDATFIDGKLLIDCGMTYTAYDASGNMIGSFVNVFESVKLIRR